jgi:hypothetical protein
MKKQLLFTIFIGVCHFAQAQYNNNPLPFVIDWADKKCDTLPTLYWICTHHFSIKNAPRDAEMTVNVSPPFLIHGAAVHSFVIQFTRGENQPRAFYFPVNPVVVTITFGNETRQFRPVIKPVPPVKFLLLKSNKTIDFSKNIIDSVQSIIVKAVWDLPPYAVQRQRFNGHFHTELYLADTDLQLERHNDGWNDGGDMTRPYEFSATKYGRKKGDVVEMRISPNFRSILYSIPENICGELQKLLQPAPQQLMTQRFRLQ